MESPGASLSPSDEPVVARAKGYAERASWGRTKGRQRRDTLCWNTPSGQRGQDSPRRHRGIHHPPRPLLPLPRTMWPLYPSARNSNRPEPPATPDNRSHPGRGQIPPGPDPNGGSNPIPASSNPVNSARTPEIREKPVPAPPASGRWPDLDKRLSQPPRALPGGSATLSQGQFARNPTG